MNSYIFRNYHLDIINTIDTLKKDVNCFISGGRDKTSCFWDVRNTQPVTGNKTIKYNYLYGRD